MKMMNKTPRTRLMTLMAAAAGVTAAVGASISAPEQALASTATSATIAADTLKNKPVTDQKAAQASKAKSSEASKSAAAKKSAVSPKSVVSTTAPNASENDVNADANSDGSGY